ncbi:MAG: GNAT family N-acetyltransferase, partial [Stenotrophomonas sp.]
LQSGDYAAWLLEVAGEAVGFAFAGPCGLPHADASATDGELKRLYVLGQYQGGGRGGLLFDAALQWLQTPGRTLWIGVWSENFGAQRFYARHGFEQVGAYEFPVGSVRDNEFILRRLAG